ncbi:polynucleotide kinase-phosphatase [Streptomyces sp. Isolate_45]|uniref:polynucleotide kinase-phosphatase n=1 Tax=Streptomyces sp. Isolate_45 TaxID=2950111 RepID=UPI002481E05F|nr:polynucleotide kinase-phosphatase [Streptomyces sp. Isolate_45]MDA5284603.1 polynucleotide kinase-phosphatase [Streptomyces sp. Isolate_45]
MSVTETPRDTRRVLPVTDLSLVVLIGATGSGKSTFARKHFKPTEVLSSDYCRGLVADDENDQSASKDAFEVLHYIAGKRLAAGRLTVVDATSVQAEARRGLVALAREHDVLPIAIVLDMPEAVCAERNAARPDRAGLPRRVIQRHRGELRRSLRGLEREGFRKVHVLRSVEEVESAEVVLEKRFNDLTHLTGPFDIIGDIHGCSSELETLLGKLGYRDGVHPEGRTAVFVGDLVDRGPDSPGVLRRVMGMVKAGHALCVPGNHENKLGRHLKGSKVQRTHGLAETIEQLDREPEEFVKEVREFIAGLVSHYVLDGGRLVVCHAGLPEKYHGRTSGRVRSHALYGETTGETDEFGLPVRYPWAEDYRGKAVVVYGHTPVPDTTWINNTICLDTGAVFGGRMTALRWPERELVDVPAEKVWYEPVKPLATEAPGGHDGRPLDLADVHGRRVVETGHLGNITVREENAAAALEVMSRFAVDPRLVPYLPPTMAPTATAKEDARDATADGSFLEHPAEAFAQYRADGIERVVCEEKHMGSRATVLLCRDADVAREKFGVDGGVTGSLYTRTGRPFFQEAEVTEEFLGRLRGAVDAAGLWEELDTDWLLIDGELLPWSLKSTGLLRNQYAAVGAASRTVLPDAVAALEAAAARGVETGPLLERQRGRAADAAAFTEAYRRYCWTTDGLDGVRFAPFQLLATAGRSLAAVPHDEQLAWLDRLAAADENAGTGLLRRTGRVFVDTGDEASVKAATDWWLDLTATGGEGMVVKPLQAYARDGKGRLVQPGIKVRGREYLRIIYGPEYTRPDHLERLRGRFLGHKRSLALREYALGLEALDRLAAGEPLWRVHEAVFAVLALESEPVDPRL